MEKKEKYWLDRFKGEIPKLDIYTDYPRPSIQSFGGDKIKSIFETELLVHNMERFVTFLREILSLVLDNPDIELKEIRIAHERLPTPSDLYRETQTYFEF